MEKPLDRAQLDTLEEQLYILAEQGRDKELAQEFNRYAKMLISLESRGDFVDPQINSTPHNAAASTLVYVLARTGLDKTYREIWECVSILEGPPATSSQEGVEHARLWQKLIKTVTEL